MGVLEVFSLQLGTVMPDGTLPVPVAGREEDGSLWDGYETIGEDHPNYSEWVELAKNRDKYLEMRKKQRRTERQRVGPGTRIESLAGREVCCVKFWLMVSLVISAAGIRIIAASTETIGRSSPLRAIDLSNYQLQLVYSNDFSKPQKIVREEDLIEYSAGGAWRRKASPPRDAEWVAEGWGGAEIRDGKLRVAPSPFDDNGKPVAVDSGKRSHMVIWNSRDFPSDFLLQFEMSPCGSTNGLTIVLFCGRGADGKDLFDPSLPPRRAEYKNYHSGAIANYTDAYWSRNNEAEAVSNRLRKNPGFKEVASGPSRTTGATNVTHHVRILKSGGHIEIEINREVVVKWDDLEEPLGDGHIGFRSMEGVTMVAYDNLKVWQLAPKPRKKSR